MALHNLVEGDCGGPSPLIRLTSHLIQDHGLKEEGLYGYYGNTDPYQSGDSNQLVKQFLEETSVHPQSFKMESLLQEMREIDQSVYPPVIAPGVVQELTGQDTAWANQYLQSGRHFDEKHADDIWNAPSIDSNFPVAEISTPGGETHEFGLGPKWAEEYLENNIESTTSATNENDLNKLSEQLINDNPNFAYSKFMKFMRQEGNIPLETGQVSERNTVDVCAQTTYSDHDKWLKEFAEDNIVEDSASNSNKEDSVLNKLEEEAAVAGSWVDEFTKKDSTAEETDNYESSLWTRLQKEWEKASISEETVSSTHPWITEYETFYDPFRDYKFHEENPMKDLPNAFEEGQKRVVMGDLPGAVLCFEAAVKQDETNADAWLMLGKTQAENEQDPLAISALKQCLQLDPANAQALMALAVSYTNESYQNQACLTLKEWLLKNEHYKHLVASKPIKTPLLSGVSTILFNEVHEEVKDLFIQAARLQPRDTIDPDVQCGLGVLFNLSSEYDKAVDCFRAALQARQNDPMLWNRLGATLANGQRSEEAVDAYHHALELSPGFIRARYNLGISCINLNAYKEAGEHLLTALNQQAAGKGVNGETAPPGTMSDTIWSTLRLVVSLMHKYHLNKAIDNRDLTTLNTEFEME